MNHAISTAHLTDKQLKALKLSHTNQADRHAPIWKSLVPSDTDDKNTNLVFVMDKSSRYYPTDAELDLGPVSQVVWYLFYPIAWAGIMYFLYRPRFKWSYIGGFVSGLAILAVDAYLYNTPNWYIINKYNQQPYQIKSERVGKGGLQHISSDYRILLENKAFPKDKRYGYIVTDDKLVQLRKEKKIRDMALPQFYRHKFDQEIGETNQEQHIYFSTKNTRLSRVSFYIIILCITMAIYISHTDFFSYHHLMWLFLTIFIAIFASGFIFASSTVFDANYVIFVKKRLLILAISWAITSILLV